MTPINWANGNRGIVGRVGKGRALIFVIETGISLKTILYCELPGQPRRTEAPDVPTAKRIASEYLAAFREDFQ